MIFYTLRRVLILLVLTVSSNAYCFIDPPTFTPAIPTAGQEVLINVRFGVCDGYLAASPTITFSGTNIEIIYQTATSGFCNIPIATLTTSLGTLAAGNYSIVIKKNNSVLGSPPILSIVGTYTLLVQQGAVTIPVPAMTPGFMIVFVITLLFLVVFSKKRAIGALSIACIAVSYPGTGIAGQEARNEIPDVQVLLSVEPGAPTSDDLLQFVANPSGNEPPLEAFRTIRPAAGMISWYRVGWGCQRCRGQRRNPDSA